MSEKTKSKRARSRAVQDGQRLVQARMNFWDDFGKDPEGVISKLRGFGLAGADLLVLDPGIEYPNGQELEATLEATFSECDNLVNELKETVLASLIDKRSKKAIIDTIRSYGSAMERRGALYVQFELRSVDQYEAFLNSNKRLKGRKASTLDERRALIVEWIRNHLPHVTSHKELTKKKTREEIGKFLDQNRRSFGDDAKWTREVLKEAYSEYKASLPKSRLPLPETKTGGA